MRITARLLILEIVAFVAFAVLAGAGILAWRLSQGPIDLEFVRPQVERSIAEARGGQPVHIEKLALEWVRDRGRVEAVAQGFTAMDKTNHVTFRADRAMIALDSGALLTFKVKPRQLRLEKGTATVVRSAEGAWTLADVVFAQEPAASDKPFDPIRDINWPTLATPIRALISAGTFEQVELVDFHLDVDDRKSGNVWSASPVAGIWKATKEGVSLNLDVTLANAIVGEPNRIRIALASDGKVERASGRVTVDGVDPVSVAKMFGYSGDAFTSGKPASAGFSVSATEKSGLQSTSLSLSNVTGNLRVGESDIALKNLAFEAAYDPATKHIDLKALTIDSDWVSGSFTGELDAAAIMRGDEATPTPFKLSGKGVTIDARPVFETPWAIETATIEGSLALNQSKLIFTRVDAVTGKLNATASGEVWLGDFNGVQEVGVKGQAVGTGEITPRQVLDYWPVALGADAREWVRDRITAGTSTKAVFNVDWQPGATAKGYLPDETLSLEFHVVDASVIAVTDLPPITGVAGVGHLKGNSLTFDATTGALGAWQLSGAKVNLPRFAPGGAMMEVSAAGKGELGNLLRAIERSQFAFGARYGLDVNQIAGNGGIDLNLRMPMVEVIKPEDVLFSIKGDFQQVRMPDLMGDFGLANTAMKLDLSEKGIIATGNGEFGPAPVNFEWKEGAVAGEDGGALLVAKARATPDLLNAFGFAARNIMQGEAGVELRASGPGGRNFDTITANLDLTKAQLDVAAVGWSKKLGAPASGSFRYGSDKDGAILTGNLRADGLEATGEAQLDATGGINGITLERLYSKDSIDLRGAISRRKDGGYRVALNGAYLNASPYMDGFLDMSGPGKGAATPVGGPGEPGPTYDIQLNVDRLKLRDDTDLRKAQVALMLGDEGPKSGTITGEIDKGKNLNVTLGTINGVRNISVKSDDAGFAARVLLKADYLIGGKLAFDGKFTGGDGNALVTMSNVRLKDAPLVAQLFALASLQGLADVLSGEGVMFTEVNAPVNFVDGRIDLPGMRATGAAMGITARGWIAPESGELSLDGVLAPSLVGANAVLGALPIIGNLFVSRQGEGMFAPTYSVRGTFARANISINPIAALTPGVLRRIFENPAEPPPTSATASN